MSDSSWDNAGEVEPRRGMPTWAKVTLGCSGGCCLGVIVIAVSCTAFVRHVSKDPEGFEKRIEGWVRSYASEHWNRFRDVVGALQSADGCRELYRGNPGLKDSYPTEADFLKAAEGWRPLLEPVPAEMPMKSGDVQFSQQGRGSYVIGYRNSKGHRIRASFERGSLSRISVRAAEAEPPAPPKPTEE